MSVDFDRQQQYCRNTGQRRSVGHRIAISTATAGSPFSVTVDAEDPFGNLVSSFTGSVTMALSNNPGSSTLGGTLVVSPVAGLAKFTTLTLNKVGTGYSLEASSSGLTAATTAGIRVIPGTASQLAVLSQPPANVTVKRENIRRYCQGRHHANNNLATGFAGKVTAAIGNNPGSTSLEWFFDRHRG